MGKQLWISYNNKMETKNWLSTRDAASYLGVSKPQVFRLIHIGYLIAELDEMAPVPYYKINKTSVEAYKTKTKNKGGRPKIKGCED